MKYLILLFFFCSLSLSFGQEINPKLVGIWEAEAYDSETDTNYYVLNKRFDDGTFDSLLSIEFTGGADNYGGSGYWWVEGNRLFQKYIFEDSEETIQEILEFEFVNDRKVKFISNSEDRPNVLKEYFENKIDE